MRSSFRLLFIVCVALMATLATAQGQGGGRGIRFMRPSGVQLLMRPEVQTELAISAEQKAKLEQIREKGESDAEALRANMSAGGDAQAMREQMMAIREAQTKLAMEVLTEPQRKRFQEISVQVMGNEILLRPEFQKQLGLTDAQIQQINDLQNKQREEMRQLRQQAQSGMSREEMMEVMRKNNATYMESLGKVLTAEQSAKLKEMGGKPFKLEERERGGG